MAEPGRIQAEPQVLDEVAEAVALEELESRAREWLDSPIAGFGNQTPRQAVKTAVGRGWVEDALKAMEYVQEQYKEQGKPYLDVGMLRHELGL
jgi:uncharacterized protein (DUF2384 family)